MPIEVKVCSIFYAKFTCGIEVIMSDPTAMNTMMRSCLLLYVLLLLTVFEFQALQNR